MSHKTKQDNDNKNMAKQIKYIVKAKIIHYKSMWGKLNQMYQENQN